MTDKPCKIHGETERTADGRCRLCRNAYFREYLPKWIAKRKKKMKRNRKKG